MPFNRYSLWHILEFEMSHLYPHAKNDRIDMSGKKDSIKKGMEFMCKFHEFFFFFFHRIVYKHKSKDETHTHTPLQYAEKQIKS